MSSLFDLRGRVAIVTGGNGGIGLGMARGLANAGAGVVVAARNAEKSSAAVRELQALGADAIAVNVDVAGGSLNSVVALYNSAGTRLAVNDDKYDNPYYGFSRGSYLRFIAPANDTYYVAVFGAGGVGPGIEALLEGGVSDDVDAGRAGNGEGLAAFEEEAVAGVPVLAVGASDGAPGGAGGATVPGCVGCGASAGFQPNFA